MREGKIHRDVCNINDSFTAQASAERGSRMGSVNTARQSGASCSEGIRSQGDHCILTMGSAKKRQQLKMNAPSVPNGTYIKIIARNH